MNPDRAAAGKRQQRPLGCGRCLPEKCCLSRDDAEYSLEKVPGCFSATALQVLTA